MQQVADSVFRLGSRGHNFYLLRDNDQITIIDAGCSREWRQLIGALEAMSLSPDDVAGVLVTHAHSDHLGLGRKAEKAGWSVLIHEDDETRALGTYEGRFAAKPTDLPLYSLTAWRNMWPMMKAGVMKLEHLEMVDTFGDGDILDLPGRPQAIHTPGHTEGHCAFHVVRSGVVFTGDCLVTMDLLGKGRGPQPIGDVFSVDPSQNRESLKRIADVEANMVLPGHGEPWAGSPAQAVEIALSVSRHQP